MKKLLLVLQIYSICNISEAGLQSFTLSPTFDPNLEVLSREVLNIILYVFISPKNLIDVLSFYKWFIFINDIIHKFI